MLTALAVALKCHPCGWTLHWGKKLRWCSMNAHQHQKKLLRSHSFLLWRREPNFIFLLSWKKTILPMLCLFKLVYPRMSPRLLSSSWRAFNLLGKQWSQIFFNVALILLGKHLFTLGLTGSKWEVCMCPLTLQLTECEILGPWLLWTLELLNNLGGIWCCHQVQDVPTVVGDTVKEKESFNEFYYCLITLKLSKCETWLSVASALWSFLHLCLFATEQCFASLYLLIRWKKPSLWCFGV